MTTSIAAPGFFGGIAHQASRNARLEPLLGDNVGSADTATRRGEQLADVGFIAGGAAAGYAGLRTGIGAAGPLGRIGGAALATAGILGASAGLRNLLFANIPSAPTPEEPAPPKTPQPPDGGLFPLPGPDPDPDPGQVPTEPTDPATPGHGGRHVPTYTVHDGEYLSHIAECTDRSWEQLYWANRDVIGREPDHLVTGERLRIPPKDFEVPAFAYEQLYAPGIDPGDLRCYAVRCEPTA